MSFFQTQKNNSYIKLRIPFALSIFSPHICPSVISTEILANLGRKERMNIATLLLGKNLLKSMISYKNFF